MELSTAEVTAVSRNSGIRRTPEDTHGHDRGANQVQVQGDTVGPAGIRKDTSLRRFGTVRLRVQIPGPRPFLYSKPAISGVDEPPWVRWRLHSLGGCSPWQHRSSKGRSKD